MPTLIPCTIHNKLTGGEKEGYVTIEKGNLGTNVMVTQQDDELSRMTRWEGTDVMEIHFDAQDFAEFQRA